MSESSIDQITITFTKTIWSPVSWLIRWALPRSRFAFALSSHCYIDIGYYLYEADPFNGVRCIYRHEALKGLTVVKSITYNVSDKEKGLQFAREQFGKKYDFKGAFGIGLNPDRTWDDPNKWFCYEYAAAVLKAAGRKEFGNVSHITETVLMSIDPEAVYS